MFMDKITVFNGFLLTRIEQEKEVRKPVSEQCSDGTTPCLVVSTILTASVFVVLLVLLSLFALLWFISKKT